jgi:translocation and assembly module TamB
MRWLKWSVRVAVGLALLLSLLALAGGAWLLGTESGLRWALGFAPPGLTLEEPRGALLGQVSFARLSYEEAVDARNVAFELNLLALFASTVSVDFLRADSIRLQRPKEEPDKTPATLPLRIRISDAQVKSVVFEGYEIHDLAADYSGSADAHQAQASFSAAGARARVKASFDKTISVEAEMHGLNIAVIDPQLPQTALQLAFSGKGTRSAFAGKLVATNPSPGPIDRERLPFARIEAAFSTDMKILSLQSFTTTIHPAGSVQGKGSASLEGARLDLRIADLDLRALYSTLRETRLSGPLELDLGRERQHVKGSLTQEDMSLTADAERSGDEVVVRALRARAGESEATGSGRVTLGEPLRFAVDLKLARFDPARFGDYPAGSINGALQANGDLGGRGSARWKIAASRLFDQDLASEGSATLIQQRISDANAWVTLGKNRASAKGAFGAPGDQVAWTLHVPDLAALAPDFGGEIRARGTARGTWKEPRAVVSAQATRLQLTEQLVFQVASVEASGGLEKHEGKLAATGADLDFVSSVKGGWIGGAWRGEILALTNKGAYPLALKTPAALEAGAQRVILGRFEAELAGGHAAVETVRRENGRLTTSGRIGALPAQWLLSALQVDKVKGDLALDGEWALAATPKLNGQVTVRRASGDLVFGDTALGLSRAEVSAKLTEDRVAMSAEVATPFGKMHLNGTVGGLTPDAALAVSAEVEAVELRTLTEPLWTQARVAGRVTASLKAGGTVRAPVLSGTLRGDALGFEMPTWGVTLTEGMVRAELDENRLRVTEARIKGGDGTFSATGSLPLARDGAATLEWQATQFRVLGRPDRRLQVSGKGITSFDGKRFGLIGDLRADGGRFEIADDTLPQLAHDVEIAGPTGKEIRVAQKARAALPVDLELKLDLGERLTVRAYGFEGGVGGQLQVTTNPAGELQAKGRVYAIKGRFRAYGQELEVDPGILLFDGPVDNPGLDVSAWRRHQQVEAGVKLTGTAQVPRVELISNPPVGENEKLSWLVLGRAPTDASGADLAVLQAAGGAVLGRGGGEPLNRRFAARLGLDELTVRSSSQLESNVVALGKRYSDKVYFSFEQAIGTTTEYLVKLDYTLTQRVSLRGQTGTTSAVGVFYRYSWD